MFNSHRSGKLANIIPLQLLISESRKVGRHAITYHYSVRSKTSGETVITET